MVRFNVEAESGFLTSLAYLGQSVEDDVIDALQDIEDQNLSWSDFVEVHGWARIELQGQDTYPGADPLFWFALLGASGTEYQIAAKGPYEAIVVCSVATIRK